MGVVRLDSGMEKIMTEESLETNSVTAAPAHPDMRWYVVDSIRSSFTQDLPVDYTSLILKAPKAPSAYYAFPGDLPVLEPGDYVGCLRNFWGDVRRDRLTVALFLGDVGRDDHVYLFVGGSHPGIYTAPLNDLVYIENV